MISWSLYTVFTVIYSLVSWTVKHIEVTSTEKLVENILFSFLKLHLNSLSFCPGGDELKGIFILRMYLLVCVFLVVLHFCYLLAVVFVIHIWPIYCLNDWYFLFKQKYAHHFSASFFRLCCRPNATSRQLHPTISSWPLQHTDWTRTRAVPSVSAAWGLHLKGRSWWQDHSWLHRMYLQGLFHGTTWLCCQAYWLHALLEGNSYTEYSFVYPWSARHRRERALTSLQQFMLTMVRIRTGMPNYVVADLFDVSPPTASRVFITWVNLMFHVLSLLLHWSSREVIADTMPQKFRDFNPDTSVITDCTEIYLERPSGPSNQAVTYNSYTSSNTAKVLVGIGPNGAFTYLAAPFGGNVSDRYIVRESGFLDVIEAGDDVIADRGFTIRTSCWTKEQL